MLYVCISFFHNFVVYHWLERHNDDQEILKKKMKPLLHVGYTQREFLLKKKIDTYWEQSIVDYKIDRLVFFAFYH